MNFSPGNRTSFTLISLWTPVVLWAGLIFYFSNVPNLKTNLGVWDFVLRKCAHVFEYAVLTFLLANAWTKTWIEHELKDVLKWCFVIGLIYSVSDEMHQALIPGRGPSAVDVSIDGVGALLGVISMSFLLKWQAVRNSNEKI